MTTLSKSEHSTAPVSHPQASLLRNVLRGNALFSIVSGALIALASGPVAAFMGIAETSIFGLFSGQVLMLEIGLGVLIFGLAVGFVATRPTINRRWAQEILVADVAWIVLSAALLLGQWLPLTTAGSWAVLIVADVVTLFAITEFIGLRRIR
jgi:hypothetical protein